VLPFTVVVAVCLAGMLVADLKQKRSVYGAFKLIGSAAFCAAGAVMLPFPKAHAIALMVGLVLSFAGDALLIPKGKKLWFLVGLTAFLSAHAAFGTAFVLAGTHAKATLAGALGILLIGAPLSRWLLPKVRGPWRVPVLAYIITITAMVTLAAGAVGAGMRQTLLVGAVLFYLSDVCVARERFVKKEPINGMIGLPLYYTAQLFLIHGLREG
jgi:uncharacterized membrane protein YhhN